MPMRLSSQKNNDKLGLYGLSLLIIIIQCTALTVFNISELYAQSITINVSKGWNIFIPKKSDGHRYGPSIMINPDKSVDLWFASTGGEGEWDWIRHRRSLDNGKTWSEETIVLRPTPDSKDRMSVCDPGVIKIGDFYYLGVTAVYDDKGRHNHVFVARSKSPTGPFEKWDGQGWGGSPEPIIQFSGPKDSWGAGEPSFIVHDQLLYIYYSWTTAPAFSGAAEPEELISQTRVATAPADDLNWPGKITLQGIAFDRVQGEDSADIKYCNTFGKFISVSTANRFSDSSYIAVRTSTNGFNFSKPLKVKENIKTWCHNAGISGTPEGHFDVDNLNFISYAYSAKGGMSWGFWHTFLNPVSINMNLNKE